MANKVKYGLKSLYYAKGTVDASTNVITYSTPVAWQGAVSISLDPQGDLATFRADNTDYWVSQNNNGYQGDLECALVPEDFRKDILGEVVDNGGNLVEVVEPSLTHFALLFQVEGDENATRHVLYNCTASRPGVNAETTAESIEPSTETVTITAHPTPSTALNKDVVKSRNSSTTSTSYSAWFTTVQIPS